MSNSEETAKDNAEKNDAPPAATIENAPKVSSENDVAEKASKPDAEKPTQASKSKKKTAKKASRKRAQSSKTGSEEPKADATSKGSDGDGDSNATRKEPIQGVRDTRAKKEESGPQTEHKAEARQPDESHNRESKDYDGDGSSQQGSKRSRRGRRGRKSVDQPVLQPKTVARVDQEKISKKAWKIFLGEVNEEGLALIGDKEAKELAKRSFRLAELFLEEEARRVPVKEVKRGFEPRREVESPRDNQPKDERESTKPENREEVEPEDKNKAPEKVEPAAAQPKQEAKEAEEESEA